MLFSILNDFSFLQLLFSSSLLLLLLLLLLFYSSLYLFSTAWLLLFHLLFAFSFLLLLFLTAYLNSFTIRYPIFYFSLFFFVVFPKNPSCIYNLMFNCRISQCQNKIYLLHSMFWQKENRHLLFIFFYFRNDNKTEKYFGCLFVCVRVNIFVISYINNKTTKQQSNNMCNKARNAQ